MHDSKMRENKSNLNTPHLHSQIPRTCRIEKQHWIHTKGSQDHESVHQETEGHIGHSKAQSADMGAPKTPPPPAGSHHNDQGVGYH